MLVVAASAPLDFVYPLIKFGLPNGKGIYFIIDSNIFANNN